MESDLGSAFYMRLCSAKGNGASQLIKEYRMLALQYHPDKPDGSHEAMACLSRAFRLVTSATEQRHVLGGTGTQTSDGAVTCEMCGQAIPVTEDTLQQGFSEFECSSCGYVLYVDF